MFVVTNTKKILFFFFSFMPEIQLQNRCSKTEITQWFANFLIYWCLPNTHCLSARQKKNHCITIDRTLKMFIEWFIYGILFLTHAVVSKRWNTNSVILEWFVESYLLKMEQKFFGHKWVIFFVPLMKNTREERKRKNKQPFQMHLV